MRDNSTGIWELRKAKEAETGRPLRIYKAHPEIGRGMVDHDLPSNAEVERGFAAAVRPSLFATIADFFKRSLFPYAFC